ncbi:MAG: aspartate 1-decarboxylase [Magnetococcales bacterium]|nr:aspartate 1-decarboxylase [Magnetococcales bacterium]
MNVSLLKCKIHRATITGTELHYEGSCAIDEDLMKAAGLREYEQIHIWNVANGERLTTYAICAPTGSGVISLNGSAAHKGSVGDLVIIAAFAWMDEALAEHHEPRRIYVDKKNRTVSPGKPLSSKAA